jgi:protein-disulfide isomerase
MLNGVRPLRAMALGISIAALGCRAQTPANPPAQPTAQPATSTSAAQSIQVGVKLTPALARRVEVMIRSKSNIPLEYRITFGEPQKSDVSGFDLIPVSYGAEGQPLKSVPFLLSTDGQTLAQMNRFDISQDPAAKVSAVDRPSRGGPATAPVTIVGFDDLECPYCAEMNAELFPAILNRYKDQVHIVYRDFPLEELHPWAKRAAIDANCLAAESTPAYWNFVDYVHAHAAEIAGTEKTLDKANQNLDKIALDEGGRQKINQPKLTACVLKQDAAGVNASILEGEAAPLNLNQAPVLFINGEKIEGVKPLDLIYRIIDQALVAAGQTPPPLPPPTPAAPPTAKPGL